MSAARSGSEVLQHLDLRVGLHLLDGVGRGLVVQAGQDAGPVARRQLVDDRGQVGRVQLPQAGVGHAQADRGDRGLDRVHVLPVDVALGQRQPQVAGDRAIRPLDAEPPQQAGRPDVDRHEVEHALELVEAQVVDPHDLAPVEVHDLLVLQVGVEQQLVGPLAELRDIDAVGVERRPAEVERGHVRPGQEDAPPVGAHDEAGHRGVAVADGDDQVGHLADRLALRVTDGAAHDLAQVELHAEPRRRGCRGHAGGPLAV